MMFAAASANDVGVQQDMISQVIAYVGAEIGGSNLPFPVVYSAENATSLSGIARYAV